MDQAKSTTVDEINSPIMELVAPNISWKINRKQYKLDY